ncbi:hypothetical protein [Bradyrhizobium cosmicum]|uniref:hypothetical protein n=1 Tax=Bradyrhizobium cosmicum TaxID=1404864 RepID=UPI0028E66BE1|nr:hypothetical protein [Bradyrhizobium cosmicum]
MDMKETSAMTEASGLVSDGEGTETSGVRKRPLRLSSEESTMRWADHLREMTMKAPLQSLFVAFLLGIWVARRR